MDSHKRSSTGARSASAEEQAWFRSPASSRSSVHNGLSSYMDSLAPRPLFTSEPEQYDHDLDPAPLPPSHSYNNTRSPSSNARGSASDSTSQWPEPQGSTPVYSPRGSIMSHRSKGTQHSRNSVQAPRSMSRDSRPEPYREGRPLDSPMIAVLPQPRDRSPSMFSFEESQESEGDILQTRRMSDRSSIQYVQHLEVQNIAPERMHSSASTGTIPASLFRDFDGVHLDEVVEEPEMDTYSPQHPLDEDPGESYLPRHRVDEEAEEPQAETHHTGGELNREVEHDAQQETSEEQHQKPAEAEPAEEDWYDQAAKGFLDGENPQDERIPNKTDEALSALEGHSKPKAEETRPPLAARSRSRWVEPPPGEEMTYYPAPVPMNISMPKRLSTAPDLNIESRRRTRWLETLADEARHSAPWLEKTEPTSEEPRGRSSTVDPVHHKKPSNTKNLPPQLRATLFFDQPAVQRQVKLKHGSAMLTLEDMLDESTTAPVMAFKGITDAEIVPSHSRSTSMMLANGRPDSRMSFASGSRLSQSMLEGKSDGRKSRASVLSMGRSKSREDFGRSKSREGLGRSKSREGLGRSKSRERLGRSQSRPGTALSNANGVRLVQSEDGLSRLELDLENEDEQQEAYEEHDHEDEGSVIHVPGRATAGVEDEEQLAEEYQPELYAAPTTLLAELEIRKAKLKQRTRNVGNVNVNPDGMHATLLQMEAVAQIERKKRADKRTALAWEDPSVAPIGLEAEAQDDEDVPLGMLFPERYGLINQQGGTANANNAMGVMDRRKMENGESLMARRNRLLGIKPAPPEPIRQPEPEEDDKSEHGDETLAQRTRRLRSRKALDDALGARDGAISRAISDDFASEMMSQFGGGISKPAEAPKPDAAPAAAKASQPTETVEETLGQRRRRLQAESMSRAGTVQPSMAGTRNLSGGSGMASTFGGFLGQNEHHRQPSGQTLQDANLGMGLGGTYANLPSSAGFPQLYSPTAQPARQGWGIPAHSFSQGFGAIKAPQPQYPRGMLWAAEEEARNRVPLNPHSTYGGPNQRTYAAGAMHQSNPSDPDAMTTPQRDNIDRWRQSVLH